MKDKIQMIQYDLAKGKVDLHLPFTMTCTTFAK